jgi:hypothetical protein
LIKFLLLIYNQNTKKIGISLNFFKNAIKLIYKLVLLILINICTIYLKIEKKLFIILLLLIIPSLLFLFCRHYIHILFPDLLHYYLSPNSAQILKKIIPININTTILYYIEEFIIGYIFSIGGCCLLYGLWWLNLDLFDYNPTEESFTEMCLMLLLQIYSKNFLEDTQEEIITTYIPLADEFQEEWDSKSFMWFCIFLFFTQQLWTIDLFHFWPRLRRRENAEFEENFGLSLLKKSTFKNYDSNMEFYKQFYPLVSYSDDKYGENYLFHMSDVYNEYIKVCFFKITPFLENYYSFIFVIFFCIFLCFIFLNLIIDPYFKNITSIYIEQITYTMYRPFLDQYFYNWYRIFINISQTETPNFFSKTPYKSQYLDLFKFIPDQEQIQISFFEKVFNSSFNYFPNIEMIDDWLSEDDETIENINNIAPKQNQETNFFFILCLSIIFVEIFRRNPFIISGKINEKLPILLPLSNLNIYSWLLQQHQTSSIFTYLNWPGWLLFKTKFWLYHSNQTLLFKTPINLPKYFTQYWLTILKKTPYLIKQTTFQQKITCYFKKKKKNIKHSIIWFGKGLIEFFLTTTIFPQFRFKRPPKKKLPYIVKKLLISYKQNRVFLLRKISFNKIFGKKEK